MILGENDVGREEERRGEGYLRGVGERVRGARARRGYTRKVLAKDSGVSERFLAQLENGTGNISILLLREVARALDVPIESLVYEGEEAPFEFMNAVELLQGMPQGDLEEAYDLLLERFGRVDAGRRSERIALIGLRGAGKSTLGKMLAEKLGVEFIELDRVIEKEAGVSLGVIFDLYGQSGFRRLERQCLDQILEKHPRFVMATGGSLVSEHATYQRLLATCFTIWLKATPEDHMERVKKQGDTRPMAGMREAMSDLRRILDGRELLYGRADAMVDTSELALENSLARMIAVVQENQEKSKNSNGNGSGVK
jgi:XRE family transcriptional regulator, aerobic/anaerobic benzoate catabolism transcriptional regulator